MNSPTRPAHLSGVLILQMGGTIDKEYPKTKNGYNFEIGDAAIKRIMAKIRPARAVLSRFETVAKKDSLDLTDEDRQRLLSTIMNSEETKIVITHGTDTMIDTADYIARGLYTPTEHDNLASKTIVFTGASTPERFKDSDADLNVGVALGWVQAKIPGIWVTMGGLVLPWDRAYRDNDGQFHPGRRKSIPVVV